MLALVVAGGLLVFHRAHQASPPEPAKEALPDSATVQKFVTQHCFKCHDSDTKKGELALDVLNSEDVGKHAAVWEKVVRKVVARQMPPLGKPRPDEKTYASFVTALETALDRAAAAHPDPGRTVTLRRLNRTEYQNVIRDLLAVDVDAAALLPAGQANQGLRRAPPGGPSPALPEPRHP